MEEAPFIDISKWEVRDQFALMLLERIDHLKDEVDLKNGVILRMLSRIEKTECHLKRMLMRTIIDKYRSSSTGDTVTFIHANNYYLKELTSSLKMWQEYAGKNGMDDDAGEDASSYAEIMKDFAICVVAGNEECVRDVGRFFSWMQVEDLEAFISWDTMPDLV